MYKVVKELASLWEETGASEEQRLDDTEAFSAVAVKELQRHVAAQKQHRTSLHGRCDALRKAAEEKLRTLAIDIHHILLDDLTTQLQDAMNQPLCSRLAALQEADGKISQQVDYVRDLREAVAEAMRVAGLEASEISGGVAALEAKMAELKRALLERRSRALGLLCEREGHIRAKDEVEFLRLLTSEVENLEMRLKAMQAGAIQAASRARCLWEKLGEWP